MHYISYCILTHYICIRDTYPLYIYLLYTIYSYSISNTILYYTYIYRRPKKRPKKQPVKQPKKRKPVEYWRNSQINMLSLILLTVLLLHLPHLQLLLIKSKYYVRYMITLSILLLFINFYITGLRTIHTIHKQYNTISIY